MGLECKSSESLDNLDGIGETGILILCEEI